MKVVAKTCILNTGLWLVASCTVPENDEATGIRLKLSWLELPTGPARPQFGLTNINSDGDLHREQDVLGKFGFIEITMEIRNMPFV
jgi:hypothetical protein